ncbi:MAG: response regulator [Campylobacteraceae bacterium]|jgi:putative two-component system response regulator|nr:response regulator [Campylobacteraceae bacterium]
MAKKLKVLSVDDDLINLKLINIMLKKNQNIDSVVEAKNGLEALEILKGSYDIDIILLDIKMPIMNGIEFLTNVGTNDKLKNIPVVVLTTDETKKYEALERGAYDFLVKPIREHELFDKIQKIYQLLS